MKKLSIYLCGLFVLSWLAVSPAPGDVADEVKQADKYVKAGKYAAAEQSYKKVIAEADPNKPQEVELAFTARRKLPVVYLAAEELTQAQGAVSQLLARHAGHERLPHAVHEIVDQAKGLNKLSQAGQLYQSLLAAQPSHPQGIWLKMGIAIVNAQLGNDSAVDTALQNIIAEHTSDDRSTEALGQIAWSYRKLQQPDKARRVYQYVVDQLPKRDRTIFSQRGIILCSLALEDKAGVAAGLDKLLADYGDSRHMPEIMRGVAMEYYRQDQLDQALAVHRYVVDKHPQSPEALWCQQDIALCGIDRADEQATDMALQKLVTDFAGDTRLPEALAGVGEHYRTKGHFKNARAVHQQVVSRFPDSAQAVQSQRNVILSDVAINDELLIQADLQTLLTQFAQDADLAPVLYYVADRLGHSRNNERLKLYQYIIDQHPEHELVVRARAKVGQIRILQGDTAAGESLFNELMTRQSDPSLLPEIVHAMAAGYYERAFVQERRDLADGQPRAMLSDEAKVNIHKAVAKWDLIIEKWPEHPQVAGMSCFYAATACYQLNDYPRALQYCSRMLEQWPQHAHAWRAQMLIGKISKRQMGEGTVPAPQALAAMTESFKQLLQKSPPPAIASLARTWLQQYGTMSEGGEQ